MKKTLFLFLLLLLTLTTHAQSWQWAKRGGSTSSSANNDIETVVEMTADREGNTYVIGRTNKYGADVDGHSLGTLFGDGCMVVASFDCNGGYRWAKPIGAISSWQPKAIAVDTLGGVYFSGTFISVSANSTGLFSIGSDTTFSTTWKSVVLIKLDTAGNYQWARLPQSDTVTQYSYNRTGNVSIDVEPNGTVHMLNQLGPGAYANGGAVITSQDLYIMKYDRQGQFLTNFKPQLSSIGYAGGYGIRMAYNYQLGRYYFTGMDSAGKVSFNGTPNRAAFYIASYTSTGTLQWVKQNALPFTLINKADYDSSGNLYLSGTTYPGDTFQNYVFTNPLTTTPHGFPFAMKLDENGAIQWVKKGQVINAGIGSAGSVYSKGVVAVCGAYPGYLAFDNFKVDVPMNTLSDGYLVRLDAATGAALGLDSAKSAFGYADDINNVAADAKSNFYVGGNMGDQLSFGSYSVTSIGWTSNWFVAKYGSPNCGCISTPLPPTFTAAVPLSGGPASFSFTSSTAGIDSVVWLFGDGQRQVVTSNFTAPVSHSYAAANSYAVCVLIFTPCGSSHKCQWVHCGCAMPPPPPTFTATAPLSGGPASFSFTSSTAGIDSLVWLFGDGQRQVVIANFTAPVSHSYAAADSYNVCVEIFTPCGSNHACRWLQIAMSVEDALVQKSVLSLAPNPATQTVQIGYRALTNSSLEIYDVLGRQIASKALPASTDSWNVDVSAYEPGIYQVVLRSSDGKAVLHKALSVQR